MLDHASWGGVSPYHMLSIGIIGRVRCLALSFQNYSDEPSPTKVYGLRIMFGKHHALWTWTRTVKINGSDTFRSIPHLRKRFYPLKALMRKLNGKRKQGSGQADQSFFD